MGPVVARPKKQESTVLPCGERGFSWKYRGSFFVAGMVRAAHTVGINIQPVNKQTWGNSILVDGQTRVGLRELGAVAEETGLLPTQVGNTHGA